VPILLHGDVLLPSVLPYLPLLWTLGSEAPRLLCGERGARRYDMGWWDPSVCVWGRVWFVPV